MRTNRFLIIIYSMLVISCGITGTRYVDYQSTPEASGVAGPGGGGPTQVGLCAPAAESIGIAFTTAACSCHDPAGQAIAPTVTADNNVNRLAFYTLAQEGYQGSFVELVAYIKSPADHGGAGAVAGEIDTALSDWAINESSVCPGLEESPP